METTAKEAAVQKSLAKNLHLLEQGLTLVRVNYPLTHTDGTKGYIDILAKDRAGNRVVIELKRSDQAGRQAIHEIFKYLSSFRQQNRFPKHRIRCFIVSTVWRELLVPFSEFVNASDVQVCGFKLNVTNAGGVRSAKQIKAVNPSSVFRVRRSQDAFFFHTKRRRKKAIPILAALFDQFGGRSGLIIELDYHGENSNVSPFALYVATGDIDGTTLRAAIKLLQTRERRLCDPNAVSEVKFGSSLHVMLLDHSDLTEIGYPEKFMSMLQVGWELRSIMRLGAVPDEDAASDEELLNAVTGIEGENLVVFERIGTPRVRDDWADIKKKALVTLQCNGHWKNATSWLLRKSQKAYPDATVTLRIYNPQHLVETLYWLLVRGVTDMIPKFEIGVFVDGILVEAIGGTMLWNWGDRAKSVNAAFGGRYGGFDSIFFRTVTHETRSDDEMLMRRHGLYYAVFHGVLCGDEMQRNEIQVEKSGRAFKSKKVAKEGASMVEFEAANRGYLIELMERYTKQICRI